MEQNNASLDLLNEIYQAADMGAQGCQLTLEKTEDKDLYQKLHAYHSRYHEIKNEAAVMLAEKGEDAKEATGMEKSRLWMGIQLNTLLDRSPSHMAEMLIQGSTMGVVKGIKNQNEHPDVDPKCSKLEDKFISLQQEHIEDMKQFL